jgi:CO/xanthine dehydrogenase Mo-binding subunit
MNVTPMGAAVRRKEDQRFITGKGRYTADISRCGQSDAYFVRSSHAHARITRIDTAVAAALAGVLAVSPSNPLGIKGCGEAGAIAAPAAVINALTDALGTESVAVPATSATVWAGIKQANRACAAE